jgi:hypothetical protein
MESALVRDSALVWFELHGTLRGKNRKLVRAPDANPMQQRINEAVLYCRERHLPCRIITLKGRQLGASSYSVAELVHQCLRVPTKALIIGDEYEKSVKNLVDMANLYVQEDTFAWGVDYHRPSKKFSNDSEIATETANDNRAAASGTYQVVLMTEVAWWKDTQNTSSAATFAAVLSCVPLQADTLVMVESTPNGVGGAYYETYQGAITLADNKAGKIPADWNGFIKVFYPWHEDEEYGGTKYPDISAAERAHIEQSLTDRESAMMSAFAAMGKADPIKRLHWRRRILNSAAFNKDEEKFEQEYPFDEDSGFLMSGRRAFSLPRLRQMRKFAASQPPPTYTMLSWVDEDETRAVMTLCDQDEAVVVVYEKPIPGCSYLLAVDPATGASQTVGGDPDNHGVGVIRQGCIMGGRWHPPKLVARLADCFAEKRHPKHGVVCKWDIDVLERRVAQLSKVYGTCMVVPEVNMDRGLIELLKQRGGIPIYQRQVFNRVEQTESKQLGWHTNSGTRAPILDKLGAAIRKWSDEGEGLEVTDLAVLLELEACIVKSNGRVEAMSGQHDDTVLMLAIGLATLDHATLMPRPRRRLEGDPDLPSASVSLTYS